MKDNNPGNQPGRQLFNIELCWLKNACYLPDTQCNDDSTSNQ